MHNSLATLIDSEGMITFARRIGAKPRTVYSWRLGERRPLASTAQRIVRAYPGRITMDDIYAARPVGRAKAGRPQGGRKLGRGRGN